MGNWFWYWWRGHPFCIPGTYSWWCFFCAGWGADPAGVVHLPAPGYQRGGNDSDPYACPMCYGQGLKSKCWHDGWSGRI